MFRNLISIGLTVTVIAVLTGAACLACFGPLQMDSKASCCTEQSSCHKPSKKAPSHAHDDCQGLPGDIAHGAPAPEFAKQIQPAELPFTHVDISVLAARIEPAREHVRPYYPPDLCLLNSQLTI